jgi:hypothetical protein
MTNKRIGKGKGKKNRRSFGCIVRNVRERLRSAMAGFLVVALVDGDECVGAANSRFLRCAAE